MEGSYSLCVRKKERKMNLPFALRTIAQWVNFLRRGPRYFRGRRVEQGGEGVRGSRIGRVLCRRKGERVAEWSTRLSVDRSQWTVDSEKRTRGLLTAFLDDRAKEAREEALSSRLLDD